MIFTFIYKKFITERSGDGNFHKITPLSTLLGVESGVKSGQSQ